VTSKLSEEEKRKRLAEMEQNAKWRSDTRDKNVSKYRDEEKREDEMQKLNKGKDMQDEASSLFKYEILLAVRWTEKSTIPTSILQALLFFVTISV
jgi:hypothetical protein